MVDAEQVRHETALTLINKKYGRGLNFARAWAAGGGPASKSAEHRAAEERETTISTHRESILWYLRQRLQECVETQQNMMEIRIAREMEKNRSVLAKARAPELSSLRAEYEKSAADHKTTASGHAASQDETPSYNPIAGLTQEQIQIFEQDNKEMLKHYESTLDQVRWVVDELKNWPSHPLTNDNLYVGRLRSRLSRSQNCKPSLWETLRRNPHISISS